MNCWNEQWYLSGILIHPEDPMVCFPRLFQSGYGPWTSHCWLNFCRLRECCIFIGTEHGKHRGRGTEWAWAHAKLVLCAQWRKTESWVQFSRLRECCSFIRTKYGKHRRRGTEWGWAHAKLGLCTQWESLQFPHFVKKITVQFLSKKFPHFVKENCRPTFAKKFSSFCQKKYRPTFVINPPPLPFLFGQFWNSFSC